MTLPRNWAQISLSALRHNYATVRDFVAPGATVCAIVKANAYGHGAAPCALALQAEGATWFGVTDAEEGIQLRQAGVTGRILLMSGFQRGEETDVLGHDLTPVIWDWNHIEALENAARKLGRTPESVPVHLKVDTGMSRLGVDIDELETILDALKSTEFLMLEGLLSHLASSEVVDAPDCDAQLQRFEDLVMKLTGKGFAPRYFHLANSAAIPSRNRSWKNMVRPGISLYGYYLPFMSVVSGVPDHSLELPVKPVLSWKTRIIALRDVGPRQPVGYNGAFVTQAPTRLAVLSVGYADGFDRHLSSRGRVIVRGDYASVVGNVSMDFTIIDVTGIPGVEIGDQVILIGESGKRKVTAWEHASHAATIPYEILCGIAARVPRIYVE